MCDAEHPLQRLTFIDGRSQATGLSSTDACAALDVVCCGCDAHLLAKSILTNVATVVDRARQGVANVSQGSAAQSRNQLRPQAVTRDLSTGDKLPTTIAARAAAIQLTFGQQVAQRQACLRPTSPHGLRSRPHSAAGAERTP